VDLYIHSPIRLHGGYEILFFTRRDDHRSTVLRGFESECNEVENGSRKSRTYNFVFFSKYHQGDQIKEVEMGG
jgi:hypothetical protein